MTDPPPVQKMSAYVTISDEDLIDAGLADAATFQRYEARQEAALYAYLAAPWHVRARRRLAEGRYEARYRLTCAVRALRGMEVDE